MDLGDDFDIYTELVDLPVRNQVLLLHSLCYIRLESAETEGGYGLFKSDEIDVYRCEPFGEDSRRNTYWYFNGLRLYKDAFISEDEREWSVVCFDEDDWKKLSLNFERSRNANEKRLYENIEEKLLDIHKITLKRLRLERLGKRYTIGGESNSNLISMRTRSRYNSIK